MIDLFQLILGKSWEFFQISWPGFNFSIGSVFLAVLVSAGALSAVAKMTGVSILSNWGFSRTAGNNKKIRIANKRKGDTK